jgi:hypothetical protein
VIRFGSGLIECNDGGTGNADMPQDSHELQVEGMFREMKFLNF